VIGLIGLLVIGAIILGVALVVIILALRD